MDSFKFGKTLHVLAVVTLATFAVCSGKANATSIENDRGTLEEKDAAENPVLVCYWGTWSHYRGGNGQFRVENIDPFLCTHLVYTFFLLDETTSTVKYADPWLDLPPPPAYPDGGLDNIRNTINLRNTNPDLKITMAIGGWTEGSTKYSDMAKDPRKRRAFILSIISMIRLWDFDGIDMDWEYPARRGGLAEDKQNFVLLLKELREELDKVNRPGKDPLLLTSAFGCGQDTIEAA
ncbi:putative chitinase 2 [Orchesella cincta]|uniref:Putative chitinase 2 n=1 Tax=Orchesella cincta TaxID=48709 RepID=A0A1D2MH90_ORCCI|nr:putative chitinase 2 [Orchesella cincta]